MGGAFGEVRGGLGAQVGQLAAQPVVHFEELIGEGVDLSLMVAGGLLYGRGCGRGRRHAEVLLQTGVARDAQARGRPREGKWWLGVRARSGRIGPARGRGHVRGVAPRHGEVK
ncbi:hypothetical protein GCM10010252_56010 [Streptomyces aureoverticillatus]|nr:hypothetical protein GCM10010252_56010 [Streptomyces aureoverticillatus]